MQSLTHFTRAIRFAVLAGSVISLGACSYNQPATAPYYSGGYQGASPVYPANPAATEYGMVSNIEVLQGRPQGQTSGAGAVLGAVVGGVLGNQVGRGTGRAAATAVGVLGGAVAGNAIEGNNNRGESVQGYRLSIQMDQGGYRAYDVGTPGDLRVGDRVRVFNGQISRM